VLEKIPLEFDQDLCEQFSQELDNGGFDKIIERENCVVILTEQLNNLKAYELQTIKEEVNKLHEQVKINKKLKQAPTSV